MIIWNIETLFFIQYANLSNEAMFCGDFVGKA